jgi:hypothetical protein
MLLDVRPDQGKRLLVGVGVDVARTVHALHIPLVIRRNFIRAFQVA